MTVAQSLYTTGEWSSLDDLMTEALDLAERDRLPLATAAERVIEQRWPDLAERDESLHRLACEGLRSLAEPPDDDDDDEPLRARRVRRDAPFVHNLRKDPQAVFRGRFQMFRNPAKPRIEDVLARAYLYVDGAPRTFASLTRAEVVEYRESIEGHLAGWQQRRDALTECARAMVATGAERIADLPAAELQVIRSRVAEAWS